MSMVTMQAQSQAQFVVSYLLIWLTILTWPPSHILWKATLLLALKRAADTTRRRRQQNKKQNSPPIVSLLALWVFIWPQTTALCCGARFGWPWLDVGWFLAIQWALCRVS